jgi:hypothetical protein
MAAPDPLVEMSDFPLAPRAPSAGCPEDVRWAILGHEEETVAAGYGEGFPVDSS